MPTVGFFCIHMKEQPIRAIISTTFSLSNLEQCDCRYGLHGESASKDEVTGSNPVHSPTGCSQLSKTVCTITSSQPIHESTAGLDYIAVAGSNPANQCRKTTAVAQLVEHEIWPTHSSIRFYRTFTRRLEYIWIVSCDRRAHNS